MSGKYKLITLDGRAKRGQLQTVHGTIETPVFMNVGTVAAIKALCRQMTSERSERRWSCAIRIICM